MIVFILSFLILIANTSKYVTVETDDNGVWWFTQNGKQFISIGVNHVNNGGLDDGIGDREGSLCRQRTGNATCGDTLNFSNTRGFSPYFNTTMDRWGSEEAWAEAAVNKLRMYGFNTAGGYSNRLIEQEIRKYEGMYYSHLLDMGTTWLTHHSFDYDPWSSEFLQQCIDIAKKEVLPRANDTHLLGWQLDNEPGLNYPFNINIGLMYFLRNDSTPGQTIALDFLENRYNGNISLFNEAWNVSVSKWDEIPAAVQKPGWSYKTMNADHQKWLQVLMGQYFKISVDAIKRFDSNHLILGIRGSSFGLSPAQNPYIDVFDAHDYNDLPDGGYCTGGFHEIGNLIERCFKDSGKPVFVGEFSFTAADSNMPNLHGERTGNVHGVGKGCPFETQTERANAYTQYVTSLMSKPMAVGFHWWQWNDEPMEGRWPDGEDANYGIVALTDDPYEVLTAEMTKTNVLLMDLHRKSGNGSSVN